MAVIEKVASHGEGQLEVKELDQVVVRFSGDSGDGMQLA